MTGRNTPNSNKHLQSAKSRTSCDTCRAAKVKCHMSQGGCTRCVGLGTACQFSPSQKSARGLSSDSASEAKASDFSANAGGSHGMTAMSAGDPSSAYPGQRASRPQQSDFNTYDKDMLYSPMEELGSGMLSRNPSSGHYPPNAGQQNLMNSMQYDTSGYDAFAPSFADYSQPIQGFWTDPITGMCEQAPNPADLSGQMFQTEDNDDPRKAPVNSDCRQQALNVLASLH